MKFIKKIILVIFITAFAFSATQGQDNSVSNLIQNLIDVGIRVGESFKVGDRVSVPTHFLIPIDLSQDKGYYIYLVMVNDNSGQLKPFYIQTQRKLTTGYNREIIEPLLIEYVGTAQYLKNRNSSDTLLFKEVSSITAYTQGDNEEDNEGTCIKGNCTNGKSTMTWSDGQKYVGQFKDGKAEGKGTWTWPNGQEYVGQFKDGKVEGKGTSISSDGVKYVGQFKGGQYEGLGTVTWPDGKKYVGQFKDGVRIGQGTMTWPDGSKYVGQWKDNKPEGQGTETSSDNKKYVGQWENGERTSGSCYDKKGRQVECDFE